MTLWKRVKPALRDRLTRVRAIATVQGLRSLTGRGYLASSGWLQSFAAGAPLDGAGEPLPWFTYPAIRLLADRVPADATVFEYGCGHSTLWWAARVARVVSVEHDPGWHRRMAARAPANAQLVLAAEGDPGYAGAVRQGAPHQLIVIDGVDRVACARAATEALTPDGVIVWDNSDRPECEAGYAHLGDAGFRRLDLWGLGPVNAYEWCTSVFYRPDNGLGL